MGYCAVALTGFLDGADCVSVSRNIEDVARSGRASNTAHARVMAAVEEVSVSDIALDVEEWGVVESRLRQFDPTHH